MAHTTAERNATRTPSDASPRNASPVKWCHDPYSTVGSRSVDEIALMQQPSQVHCDAAPFSHDPYTMYDGAKAVAAVQAPQDADLYYTAQTLFASTGVTGRELEDPEVMRKIDMRVCDMLASGQEREAAEMASAAAIMKSMQINFRFLHKFRKGRICTERLTDLSPEDDEICTTMRELQASTRKRYRDVNVIAKDIAYSAWDYFKEVKADGRVPVLSRYDNDIEFREFRDFVLEVGRKIVRGQIQRDPAQGIVGGIRRTAWVDYVVYTFCKDKRSRSNS